MANFDNYMPIDVVIAWVDGDDPKLIEKRQKYLQGKDNALLRSARPTLFASVDEIKYCVLSIFRFAPFVRNVYIVTDDQTPDIFDDVKKFFPSRLGSIRIIDHKEIFKGFEEFLPTFNSISIGNMVWRIEGLSENFVYFNDDIFLIRDVHPDDWVINGKPVIRGEWRFPPYKKVVKNAIQSFFKRKILRAKDFTPKFSFFLIQWNAASILGMRFRYLVNGHTPHVMNRKTIENFFEKNIKLVKQNISFRFRNKEQFNISTLANHLEVIGGNKQVQKFYSGYLNPAHHSKKRFKRKVRQCDTNSKIKSVCVQSLDMASTEDRNTVYMWMDNILGFNVMN